MANSDDDQKHNQAQQADEELVDEDIDATQASVGLQNDDNGPQELNSKEVIDEANKSH